MENDFTISVIGWGKKIEKKETREKHFFISSEREIPNEHKINSTANDADEEKFRT
jgi:hypothetical protein